MKNSGNGPKSSVRMFYWYSFDLSTCGGKYEMRSFIYAIVPLLCYQNVFITTNAFIATEVKSSPLALKQPSNDLGLQRTVVTIELC